MNTQKLYLNDSYLYSAQATILSYQPSSTINDNTTTGSIILNATCFYPQGGGQPSDEGTITVLRESHEGASNDELIFIVKKVMLNENSEIVHIGEAPVEFWDFLLKKVASNILVQLQVNQQLRMASMRLHTAGHMLDVALSNLGFGPEQLIGVKGCHFSDSPYVEFLQIGDESTSLTAEDLASLPSRLTTELRNLVTQDLATEIVDIAKEHVFDLCASDVKGMNFDKYPDMIRMVKVCGKFIPCGGTHTRSSGEIGMSIEVTKIKKKKNIYRISYSI